MYLVHELKKSHTVKKWTFTQTKFSSVIVCQSNVLTFTECLEHNTSEIKSQVNSSDKFIELIISK